MIANLWLTHYFIYFCFTFLLFFGAPKKLRQSLSKRLSVIFTIFEVLPVLGALFFRTGYTGLSSRRPLIIGFLGVDYRWVWRWENGGEYKTKRPSKYATHVVLEVSCKKDPNSEACGLRGAQYICISTHFIYTINLFNMYIYIYTVYTSTLQGVVFET